VAQVSDGDDAGAKAEVVALFEDAGFAAIDLGGLKTGGEMQQIHTRSPAST
jgi:8-hydroxy-5-deazaflavin:NADPH oxidoreductase